MSFLLDSDICSTYLRQPGTMFSRFVQHSGNLATSTINLAELYAWAYGRNDPTPMLLMIQRFMDGVNLIPVDEVCSQEFGRLRIVLRRSGVEVASFDLMIATIAIVHDCTLVTHNVKDFENIPGLRWVDWLAN